jgi:hypothetical protein
MSTGFCSPGNARDGGGGVAAGNGDRTSARSLSVRALTKSRPKGATMARQKRSTTFAQESTHPITRVALYARVSTLNNEDPEMQLAELRESE